MFKGGQQNYYLDLKDFTRRLRRLQFPTLVYHRLRGNMIEVYKVMWGNNERVAPPNIDFFEASGRITGGHMYKLMKNHHKTRVRQHCFVEHIVNRWNSLPQYIIEAASIATFEGRPDRFWREQEVSYIYEAVSALGVELHTIGG